MKDLKIGDSAPDFKLSDKEGKLFRLSDFKGKKVAIYFYPKDNTPGCTKQACNIRDNFSVLEKEGIIIIGISIDDEKSHEKFVDKYNLPFILLSDKEKEVVNKYGVYGEKSFMGKKYFGTSRKTFLIDEEGEIVHIIEKPKVSNHAQEIIDCFKIKN
ncbi:thioredoxin-dependent thiol peroxidase [archaeon]|nr:thioredoxin-dependent thiol peroxidase [archaeon]MBT4647879.1 thioredoxin-dependent thiol peroxidase [archaeon]MBT6821595.1 thioredoxin-dependent thiol peroxidase [archaeon]